MHDWALEVTAIHDRLRRRATRDRLLVAFVLPPLPERHSPGGAAVLEAWRWFQNQPGTGAGLVVASEGSPAGRDDVLAQLRDLAGYHGLRIPADLFAHGDPQPDRWRGLGWEPVAIVDARPTAGTREEAAQQGEVEIGGIPVVAAPELAIQPEGAAVRRTRCEVTWCGVGSREDLDAFLGSTVDSAELPVARGTHGEVVIDGEGDSAPLLEEVLGVLAQLGKGARLRLDADQSIRRRALRVIRASGFPLERLRLAATVEDLGVAGLADLREACPDVGLECSIDFLGAVLAVDPTAARKLADSLAEAGVGRFMLDGRGQSFGTIASALDSWGLDYDVRGLNDLRSLLGILGTGPAALSTDFGLSARPQLRQTIDAAMGAAPPVARTRGRERAAAGGRRRR